MRQFDTTGHPFDEDGFGTPIKLRGFAVHEFERHKGILDALALRLFPVFGVSIHL